MSTTLGCRQRYSPKFTEICVGNISRKTKSNDLLNYFQRFGGIIHYNLTSPTGGYVFITYEDPSMVDKCMRSRPHNLDGQHLYVKRALPVDDEHPRERFETTRDLMIVIDFDDPNCTKREFLTQLRNYFLYYGTLYDCKICHEKNFDYILVQFGDKDQVDRIILDKPHYYDEHILDVMKYIPSNIEIMNEKYSLNKKQTNLIKDAIDDDDNQDVTNVLNTNILRKNEQISEVDLQNEVYRLQNTLKKMSEDFALQRQQLEDDCCEQLKKLNENTEQNQRLQQDLEQEYSKLSAEYESIKNENDALNEQYLSTELENFEITSYYEQILAEEKAKTTQLELEYNEKLKNLHNTHSSPSLSPNSSRSQFNPIVSNKNKN